MQIKLKILSPEGVLMEEDCDYIRLDTEAGGFGIMYGHIPVAAMLKGPKIIYKKDNLHEAVDIKGGFARVLPDCVTIFTGGK